MKIGRYLLYRLPSSFRDYVVAPSNVMAPASPVWWLGVRNCLFWTFVARTSQMNVARPYGIKDGAVFACVLNAWCIGIDASLSVQENWKWMQVIDGSQFNLVCVLSLPLCCARFFKTSS